MEFQNRERLIELRKRLNDPDSDEHDREAATEEMTKILIADAKGHRRKVEHVPDESERMRDQIAERNWRRAFPDWSEDDDEWQLELRKQEAEDRRDREKAEAEERRLQEEEEFDEKYRRECEADPNFAKRDFIMRQQALENEIHVKLEDEDPSGPESNLEIENRLLRRWGPEYVSDPAFVQERDRRVLEAVTLQGKPWSYKTFDDVVEQMNHEVTIEEERRYRCVR